MKNKLTNLSLFLIFTIFLFQIFNLNAQYNDTHAPIIYFEMDSQGNVPALDKPNSRAFIKDTANHANGEETSGFGSMLLSQSISFNYSFQIDDYPNGTMDEVDFELWVMDKCSKAQASLRISDRAGNQIDTLIKYTPNPFELSPKRLNFGEQKFNNQTVIKEITITNTSPYQPMCIQNIFMKSSYKDVPFNEYDPNEADVNSAFKFDLENLPYNTYLAPLETATFNISFTPDEIGIFTDSIGITTCAECGIEYLAQLNANVVSAKILVSDIDFGDVAVGTTVSKTFTITNNGNTWLYLEGSNVDDLNPVFTTDSKFTNSGINSGTTVTYTVQFTPQEEIEYSDVLIITTNADPNDPEYKPFCTISGRGVNCTITANDYNWGRRRAALQRYETLDYINIEPYAADEDVIKICNPCQYSITLKGVSYSGGNSSKVFLTSSGQELVDVLYEFDNFVMEPVSEFMLPIKFYPQNEGPKFVELTIFTDPHGGDKVTIRGIGTYPEAKTSDVSFGAFNHSEYMVKYAEITNDKVNISSEEYLDELTIYDIEIIDGQATFDENEWGKESVGSPVFYIDKSTIDFPVTLVHGDEMNNLFRFPIKFKAGYNGIFNAQLRTISDSYEEGVINISGDNSTSVNEADLSVKINIYPNPVANEIQIQSDVLISKIEINDELGRLVSTYKDSTETISTKEFASGIYFINVYTSGGELITKKISIVH